MPIPQVDPDEVSQGILGIHSALLAAEDVLGDAQVAYFLEQVPERGEALWRSFCVFRDEQENADFADFIANILATEPMIKFLYPKECLLDQTTRATLASTVLAKVLAMETGVFEIYFAEDPSYTAARNITCRGCPMRECQHWLKGKGKSRRR